MNRRSWAVCAPAWAAVLFVGTAAVAERQFDFKDSRLENGLRVITLEDFSTPIVTVQMWYGVGSKDENPSRQGFAHMFEHMMFRGTSNLGPEAYFQLINGVGGSLNGTTSFDRTNYYQTVPANQLELALWLEAERMLFLTIDEDGFETERAVVEEERRQGLNAPYGTLIERILPVLFPGHPYRWSAIGRIAHLRAAGIEELRHFWDTQYVPGNATLVIVGAVSHKKAAEAVEKYFGWIPKLPMPVKVDRPAPEQTTERVFEMKERLGPVPVAGYVFRTIPGGHEDWYALQLAFDTLVGGESSRMHVDLVKERKLAVQMIPLAMPLQLDGFLGLGAALAPFGKRDMEPVLAAIEEHIARVMDEGVTARELEKAKNRMLRNTVTAQLTVVNKAFAIGNAVVTQGGPEWLNEQLDKIDAITNEDVKRVAKTYFASSRRTVLRITPDKDFVYDPNEGQDPVDYTPPAGALSKAAIERPRNWSSTPPKQPVQEDVPKIEGEEKTLSNGLRVVVVENHEVPFVTAQLGLKYGAWAEDPAHPGVASMALGMLTKGTAKHTANELAEAIEFDALTLGGNAGLDVASVTASALPDNLPRAIELLAEVVTTPAFPEDELTTLKRLVVSGLAIQARDPKYQADRELRRRIYGTHPYARTAQGEVADVNPITSEQIAEWWNKHARPGRAVLYFAGDVSPNAAFRIAEEYLGAWTVTGDAPAIAPPPVPDRQATHIYLVDEPGAVQSEIRIGQISIDRNHPDYYTSRVFNQIFGGSFGSRLNKAIRVDLGLTYGARGSMGYRRFTGQFNASTFTKTESTAETLKAVLDVIDDTRDRAPTDDEMDTAKSYLIGSIPGNFETPQGMVSLLWSMEYNNLPKDHMARIVGSVREATSKEVHRIANAHVDPDYLTIVVLGDASKVKKGLEEIGPVTVVE